jgi:LacI family gluconate utilization system Gnt-I transcriptional repressor
MARSGAGERLGRQSGRVRIEDVARVAGVSPITVSRALRQPELVSERARASVAKAMREVGYVPDLVAGSLASNRTNVIAMVVPTLASSVIAEPIDAIPDMLGRHGYHVLIANSGYDEVDEEEMIWTLLGRRPDGMVLIGVTHSARTRKMLKAARIPIVETWDLTDQPIDMVAGFSNFESARAIVRLLGEVGYRHIAHVTTSEKGDSRAAARRRGYAAALAELELGEPWVIEAAQPQSYLSGRSALARLIESDRELDAVFFANDVLATGALLECQRRGIEVPRHIGIAGFGDAELSAQLTPALTTVKVPRYEISRRAAELLLARLHGETVENHMIDLGFQVLRRESA